MREKTIIKKLMFLLSVFILIISVHAFAAEPGADVEPIMAELDKIDQTGNMELTTKGSSFLDSGFELGDIVEVTVNNRKYRMPVVEHYSDVDKGAMLCRVAIDPDESKDRIDIAVNLGDFAEYAHIAVRVETDEAPGYKWVLNKAVTEPINVMISMDEKGGYLEQLDFHHLKKSSKREDYPQLDDEAYANFREVTTTGMGDNVLYRSSTPFNPSIDRSKEADAACRKHKIKTIMNMTDSDKTMRSYEGYADSYSGTCNVICLNMVVDYESDSFRNSLADGLTYLASQEGPYLVHCTEGKDRAGFASAVLEALMGASDDEIIQDYMVTYENYYGVKPGDELYTKIADANIKSFLADAFGLDTLEGKDLSAEAEKYLKKLGLTEETIENLKRNLKGDYKETLPEDVKAAYADIIVQLEEEYGPAHIVTWEDRDGNSYPHCSGLYYMDLIDMDKNGTDELVLGYMGYKDGEYGPQCLEVYTDHLEKYTLDEAMLWYGVDSGSVAFYNYPDRSYLVVGRSQPEERNKLYGFDGSGSFGIVAEASLEDYVEQEDRGYYDFGTGKPDSIDEVLVYGLSDTDRDVLKQKISTTKERLGMSYEGRS